MLWVFDLLCNGLRDPRGVFGRPSLSWRLGSDRNGACQASYRVVVVSLLEGEVVWDTGMVASDDNVVEYGGPPLGAGTACSWFVAIVDDAGDNVQSVPAAFVWGKEGDEATSALGPQRLGCAWCSDESLNRLWETRDLRDVQDAVWRDILGVYLGGLADRWVVVEPNASMSLEYAQGSLLLSRGLLVVRWERDGGHVRLDVSLPPGVEGELVLLGRQQRVSSGRHVLQMTLQ